jgi:acyl dehydratase
MSQGQTSQRTTTTLVHGLEELKSKAGEHLGDSDYLDITEERVYQFADATGDHQWIHVDPERAKEGPFGAIEHGYLTVSLGPMLARQVFRMREQELQLPWRSPSVH